MPQRRPAAQYRHGDVMIEAATQLPDQLRKLPHTILAHGELTGHCHRIADPKTAEVFDTPEGMFLKVTADEATVVHDEHHGITLPEGIYRVWRQREYSPEEIRIIRD